MDISQQEWTICPAIWIDDGQKHENQPENITSGYVVYGNHLVDVFFRMTAGKTGEPLNIGAGNLNEVHEGYLTNLNRFVETFIDY